MQKKTKIVRRYNAVLVLLGTLFVTFFPSLVFSQSEEFRSCGEIEDNAHRLDCFDAVFEKSETRGKSISRDPLIVTDASFSKEILEASFGLKKKDAPYIIPKKYELKQIMSRIIKVTESGSGRRIIELENGHRWYESNPAQFRIYVDQSATIKRSTLSSFILIPEKGRYVKVRRIK